MINTGAYIFSHDQVSLFCGRILGFQQNLFQILGGSSSCGNRISCFSEAFTSGSLLFPITSAYMLLPEGRRSFSQVPPVEEMQVRSLGQEDPLERKWHSTPLFLENPVDRGAWRATVCGVANSLRQLSTKQQQKSPGRAV